MFETNDAENPADFTYQTFTPAQPHQAVVFSDEGVPFYSLDALVAQYVTNLVPEALMARISGDPEALAVAQGKHFIINHLKTSRDVLATQREAHLAVQGEVTLADFGIPEDE